MLEEVYGLGLIEGIISCILNWRPWDEDAFQRLGLIVLVQGSAFFLGIAGAMIVTGCTSLKQNYSMIDQVKDLQLIRQKQFKGRQKLPRRTFL